MRGCGKVSGPHPRFHETKEISATDRREFRNLKNIIHHLEIPRERPMAFLRRDRAIAGTRDSVISEKETETKRISYEHFLHNEVVSRMILDYLRRFTLEKFSLTVDGRRLGDENEWFIRQMTSKKRDVIIKHKNQRCHTFKRKRSSCI